MPNTERSDVLNTPNEPKVRWTAEEKEYLLAHYEKYGVEKVANYLNRSRGSVATMAHYLGVATRKKRGTRLSEEERAHVKSRADLDSISRIARDLNRNELTIQRYMKSEGLGIYANRFCCNPPDSCFVCPYDDCVCCKCNNTPKEAEFLRIGMERTVGEGTVVRRRV